VGKKKKREGKKKRNREEKKRRPFSVSHVTIQIDARLVLMRDFNVGDGFD
jgi:hypothetical protein